MLPAFLAPDGDRRRHRRLVPPRWRMRMRRWRRHPIVGVVAVVGLAASGGLTLGRVAAHTRAEAVRYGSAVRVPVAVRTLAVGDTVGEGDVEFRRVPRAFVPAGHAARRPVGHVVVATVVAGEVVVEDRLAPTGLHGAAALVPAGWRALAVPSGPGTPRVGRGDHVDLLAATGDGDGPSTVVGHGAVVVEVSDQAVTVALSQSDAPSLAAALARGAVSIALIGA